MAASKTDGGIGSATAFRPVPRTGVIFVMREASRLGYRAGDPAWSNLGQGQPETGALPGAPPRISHVDFALNDNDYASESGLWELREAVANLYNALYRRGKKSQYAPENVAISGGGRLALTRAAAAIGPIHLGHFLPDYTAYEELLEVFKIFTPIPISLDAEENYAFGIDALRKEILGRGLGGVLLSNPRNPTGKTICGDELASWVATARELDCTLLMDEFYSNYVWVDGYADRTVSAAEFVEDVDRDPVVIFNGLTKNWRYPGWRVAWTVGPKSVIDAVGSAASFLDGGGARPMQRAALPLITAEHVRSETRAIHQAFGHKRRLMVDGLRELGVHIQGDPEGTFYVWGDVGGLRGELSDGMQLFRAALGEKVIVVPGEFFDVNPGKRRGGRASRFRSYVRFSFGPPAAVLEQGLAGLRRVLQR